MTTSLRQRRLLEVSRRFSVRLSRSTCERLRQELTQRRNLMLSCEVAVRQPVSPPWASRRGEIVPFIDEDYSPEACTARVRAMRG